MSPILVLKFGLKHGYPAFLLVLEMLAHLSPRVLRSGKCFSRPVQAQRSIVAGVRGANDFGRLVLYDLMESLHNKWSPTVISKSFVDDVNQRAQSTLIRAKAALMAAGLAFSRGCAELDLTVSPKSRISSSLPQLGQRAAEGFNSRGIPVRFSGAAPDLGLDRGHRAHVYKPKTTARIADAFRIGKKICKKLGRPRMRRLAKRIANTMMVPKAKYSMRVFGAPP